MSEAAHADGTRRRARGAVVGVLLAAALVPLNSTMIAVALLDIEGDLDVGVATVTWLVSGYLVAMALAQPAGGRLGDLVGHRWAFIAGLAGFTAVSALAAVTPWFAGLVVLRIVQALVGGLMMPSASALLRDLVPPERRGLLFGWFGTVMGLAAAVGPVLGGALVAGFGWRAIFLVNLPIGAAALALAAGGLPAATRGPLRGLRLDLPGAAAFTAAVGGLVATLFLLPRGVVFWLPAALATIGALALFVAVEKRVRDPFVSLDLFRNRPFVGASATVALHNLSLYSLLLILPILAADRLDLGPVGAGLLLGLMSGAMMATAPAGGHLSDRLGRRAPGVAGGVLITVGTLGLTLAVNAGAGVGVIAPLLAVCGMGIGLAGASLQTTAIESAPAGMVALAGGVFMTSRYTGGIAASGIAAAVAGSGRLVPGLAILAVSAVVSLATASLLPGRIERPGALADGPAARDEGPAPAVAKPA